MNKRIDLSNLGGFPMTQFTLSEMQDSYRGALGAIATLAGSKVILQGVEIVGGNVTAGWISYNGELIPFMAGAYNDKVVITEAAVSRVFEDTAVYDAYFTKTATCAAVGDFDFGDLVTLLSFQNIWLPGDLKQKYVDNDYIAANFDVDGYGLLKEKGWRILSKAVPDAAGKVFVNRDPDDEDFDTVGQIRGEKEHTLTQNEQGSLNVKGKIDDVTGGAGVVMATVTINGITIPRDGGSNQSTDGSTANIKLLADAVAHNNLQPSFVVLTLIKL